MKGGLTHCLLLVTHTHTSKLGLGRSGSKGGGRERVRPRVGGKDAKDFAEKLLNGGLRVVCAGANSQDEERDDVGSR